MDLCCVRISSFAVDDSVGWLVQVSLTLFAFTPSTSLALPVNAKNVRLTCTSQPKESSTAKLEIRTQHKSAVHSSALALSARTFFYLSKYSLSDAHFSTGRLLFEFNRLQYTLAAPEVFVSSANPVILPSGYRVSIVRNTNIDQIETTPLRYCMLHAC